MTEAAATVSAIDDDPSLREALQSLIRPMTVRAMKAGAVVFLTKPVRDHDVPDAIQQAIACDPVARQQRADLAALPQRCAALTPREREVMPLAVSDRLDK
jgi:FixJ family two-component response regulator